MTSFRTIRGKSASIRDAKPIIYVYADDGRYLGSLYAQTEEMAGELERRLSESPQLAEPR